MSIWQNIGGVWRKGTLWQNIAGTWRKGVLWQNVGGVWKTAGTTGGGASGLTATANPPAVYGAVSRAGANRVSTNQTTVSVSGGTAPYTFAWAPQVDWNVTYPGTAVTSFNAVVSPDGTKMAEFVCTVTDAKGIATSVTVSAEVSNYYSGGRENVDLQ